MEHDALNERNSQDDEDVAPPLPPRPAIQIGDELPSSPNHPRSTSIDEEPLKPRRKPVLPDRSSHKSLGAGSYEPVEMEHMDSSETLLEDIEDEEVTVKHHLPPKAFRKVQSRLGYWRMPVRHLKIFSVLFMIVFLSLYFLSIGFRSLYAELGLFEFDCYGTSSGWTFVGINLRFGRFNYGGAKALDLAWNWIVGRGVQGILTYLAYRVFSDALLRVAEMTALPYQLYVSLALYSTKADILWQLIKGINGHGNWRSKMILLWLFVSTVYLIAFPSLMDACSGYESSYSAEFQWPNGSMQDVSELEDWQWTHRPDVVNVSTVTLVWNVNQTDSSFYNFTYYPQDEALNLSHSILSNMDWESGFTVYYWVDSSLNTSWWGHFAQDPFAPWTSWDFYPSNTSHYKCVAQNNVYVWGFSFEWLFIVAILNSGWLVGLWIVWIDSDTNSEFCKKGRRLGIWRAIADISEAMREELGPNTCAYSEQELAEILWSKPPIKYCATRGTVKEPGHIGLSSRPSGRLKLEWNREYGLEEKSI